MTKIYLIRHAEAEGNLYRRAHGHYNSTITELGYRQIAALRRRFEGVTIDAAYASDLCRTCTTAKAITLPRGLALQTTPLLREVGIGVWEDKPWAELEHFEQEALVCFNSDCAKWSIEGGETLEYVRERMMKAIRMIAQAHPDQTVAVFSHGMALRTLIGTLQGLSLDEINETGHADNTAVTELACEGSEIRVLYRDDASHLGEKLSSFKQQTWWKNKKGLERGIYFMPTDKEGCFAVRCGDACVGEVSVVKRMPGVAEIDAFRLDACERGKGYGIRLVGQAIGYARTMGCDILRISVPRSEEHAMLCAQRYAFTPVRETPDTVVFEKYFGYSEEYQNKKIQEAIEKC